MNPVNPIFAFMPIFAAFCSLFIIIRLSRSKILEHDRFSSIDGFRGYLALAVFLHHACIWYFYLRTGKWQVPPSNLFTNFGQTGVAFFFMITGFLFYTKLIHAKTKPIDWLRLFVSRLLRLAPLYVFAMALMFTVVAVLSDFTLQEPPLNIVFSICRWLTFTISGMPNINEVIGTNLIVAGVTWSLPYEWAFYFSLPLLAMLMGRKVSWKYLVIATLLMLLCLSVSHMILNVVYFFGGIGSAYFVRFQAASHFAKKNYASILVLLLIVVQLFLMRTAYSLVSAALLSFAFALIASGATLFGFLVKSFSLVLGEMAYSIYLLHGLILFITFNFIFNPHQAAQLSALQHWSIISVCSFFLILISFMTYTLIEAKSMRYVQKATQGLRNYLRYSR